MATFEQAMGVPCPKCGAKPGVGCTLMSGKRKNWAASTLHNERLRVVNNTETAEQREAERQALVERIYNEDQGKAGTQ